MVTKLQQSYIGSHEETLIAQQQRLLCWLVDQSHDDVVPVACETTFGDVRSQTFLRETRARRTAEVEHDFTKDKGASSAPIEGVAAFHLETAVDPKVVRIGEGLVKGTGQSKPVAQATGCDQA